MLTGLWAPYLHGCSHGKVKKGGEERVSYPAAIAIEAGPAAVERWQKVIDAHEEVRADFAAKVRAATGATYPVDVEEHILYVHGSGHRSDVYKRR